MTAFLIILWVASFFATFLYLQHADREFDNVTPWSTYVNLVMASIPVINLLDVFIAVLYMNL